MRDQLHVLFPLLFITKGVLPIQLTGWEDEVSAGSVAYTPRFTPHDFRSDGEETDSAFNPAHKREGFIEGLYEVLSKDPVDPDKFLTLFYKYDSYPVDTTDMLPIRKSGNR